MPARNPRRNTPRTPASPRPGSRRPQLPAGARALNGPVFAQPKPTPDPTRFRVKHPSDDPVYQEIDAYNKAHGIHALPFPPPRGGVEPTLTLEQVLGGPDAALPLQRIAAAKQIVFHATGDCGSTRNPVAETRVVDKMVADFHGEDDPNVPQFNLLLGDIVYSFGELEYYYDQFYEPYRDYPAPILAAAGNHDGMVPPNSGATSLNGFLRNFCATDFVVTPEAGGLSRTAQIQPGVFFTFESPYVRIIVLYSNALEDPGVISDADVGTSQLAFLEAALRRVKSENFRGALLLAHHHPPYVHGAKHGWSIAMQQQIDDICTKVGVWPHADLAGHAHNYQRFTRTRRDGTEIPYIVCGNGGHNVQRLHTASAVQTAQTTGNAQSASSTTTGPIRVPVIIQAASGTNDQLVFENYDDVNYGYLRIIVTQAQLRIEYHPASDGDQAKTPDDAVTVDLATRKLVHFQPATMQLQTSGAPANAIQPTAPAARKASGGRKKRGT